MALKFLNNGYFAGKVGIGTASPGAALEVRASASSPFGALRLSTSSTKYWQFNTIYNNTDPDLFIAPNGGAATMTLESTGNVGIGTTVPDYKLDIRNGELTVRPSFSGNVGLVKIGHSSSNAILQLYDSSANENVRISTSLSSYFNGGNVGIGTTSPTRTLHVVGGDGGTGTHIAQFEGRSGVVGMYVRGDGNVGIGTTSPGVKLDVNGESVRVINANPKYYLNNSVVQWHTTIATNDYRIHDGIDDRLTIKRSSGNVGIGTTSPTQKLHVAGNARVTGAYYDSNNSPGTANQVLISTVTGTDWVDGSAIPGVPAGSGTVNTIPLWTPDGNTLGNSPITVSGNNATFAGEITATNIYAETYRSSRADGEIYIQAATASDFVSIGTQVANNLMRIQGSGNVGIGTSTLNAISGTNPTLTLGGTGISGGLILQRAGTDKARLYENAGNMVHQGMTGVGHHFYVNAATQAMVINSSGNVGIGVTGPSYKLDVNGIIRSENSSEVGTLYLGNTAQSQIPGGAIIGQRSPSYSSTGNLLFQVPTWGAGTDYGLTTQMSIEVSTSDTKKATISMIPFGGNVEITNALLSNQENTDVDTGTETVANVAIATYTAAFFDFVIKKTTNVRSGTVYACHDGTNVEFTETSTQDLGDTSDVTLSVDISGANMRLLATVTSDDWSVKSLIRAI